MDNFNFHWNKNALTLPLSSRVLLQQVFLSTPSKIDEHKISTARVQLETMIYFTVGEEEARTQAERREPDMLALRVIASQPLIRAVVFYRYLVSNVMNVVDYHNLQKEKEK